MNVKRALGHLHGLNVVQKCGLFISVASLLILGALHNPTDGYVSIYVYTTPGTPVPPTIHEPMSLKDADTREKLDELMRQHSEWAKAANASLTQYHEVDLNFLDWQSKGAFFPAFSGMKNFLMFLLVTVACGVAWIWIFKPNPPTIGA